MRAYGAPRLAAAGAHGIAIPSMALGVLNEAPLKSDERAAVWVHDSIDVAHNLARIIHERV